MKVWYILMLLVRQWGKVGIITINSVPPTESSWICHFLIGQIKPIFFFHNAHTVYYTCAFSSLPSVLFFFNDYLVIRHWLGSSKLPPLLGIGTLRNYDSDGNGNVKKAISLMSKTTSCPCITLFCTFLCSPCTTTTWNDQILSLLGNGKRNCKAINSSISVRTWVRSLLFSSKLNSLLLSNWAPRNNREK